MIDGDGSDLPDPGHPTGRCRLLGSVRVDRRAPAHTRLAKARPAPPRTVVQRVKHRVDLIGWLLGQPNDRVNWNTDPTDPRVLMYNKINATSQRYTGLYASLLRFNVVRT